MIDCTFWWKYWVIVFRDNIKKENVLYYEVQNETKDSYKLWIKWLLVKGFKIKAIIADGVFWLEKYYLNIPIQMCHFHQKAIIRRKLTKNPILEENKELKEITYFLWRLKKETRLLWLNDWYNRNIERLKERNENWILMHSKTKSAFNSLKRNSNSLFMYSILDFPIPKTTNSLEATFWHLKDKLRNHRWLIKSRKLKLIYYLLN